MRKKLITIVLLALTAMAGHAQTLQQADSLHQRGRELLNEGKIAEGRECTRQAMEMRKTLLGEVSEGYITSLNNYALTYSMEENYTKAKEIQQVVMELCNKLPIPHPDLAIYATNMGADCYFTGDINGAANYWEMALPLVDKFSERYEKILTGLGLVYDDLKDSRNQNRIMALMEEHNQHELEKPCDEPKCMLERAQYYGTTGNQTKAKECYQTAVDMPMDDEMKVTVFESYAKFLTMTAGDRLTGAEFQRKAATLRKNTKGENADYAKSIYNAGLYYCVAKDSYQNALPCFDSAMQVFEKLHDAKMVAKCQQMKGNAFLGIKEFGKAKECYQAALAYYEANDRESDEYPKMIERVAAMEKFNKEYEASITHYRQAMQLFEQRGMMKEYGDAESGLQLCYAHAGKNMEDATDGRNDEAVKAAKRKELDGIIAEELEGLELTRTYLGKMTYARSLAVIASCYAMKEDYKNALDYYRQYMEVVRDGVREEFRYENETERMHTWREEASTITELEELLVELPNSLKSYSGDVASLVYDAELLSKGILLNSAIEFEKVLGSKNDTQLTDIYQQTKANRNEIERLRREASTDDDLEKILKLTQENQRLQNQLNQGCREMEDFTRYLSYSWKDVQRNLKDGDVSIEFAAVNLGLASSESHMVALLLTKDMVQPTAVVLWNEDDWQEYNNSELARQLMIASITGGDIKAILNEARRKLACEADDRLKPEKELYIDLLEHQADTTSRMFTPYLMPMKYHDLLQQDSVMFTKPEVGQIVWGRLSSYLQGKKRIFFSADGILNHIGIEYLPSDGKPLSEQFEVYRLSSTKELCYRHESTKPAKAALFGDINYNEGPQQMVVPQKKTAIKRESGGADGLANLEYTLREVNEIASILKNKGVKETIRYRDVEASKQTFLALTDSKVNILHLATHGMYKDERKQTDTESMQNSLLAFAGAGLDSLGYASAADIAMMNLRQCDLAVLSACETGLGKLGSDGVFGLQRGFKNAGVHTLLMSLKNVYDESTAELMIAFYKHLMAGASKREALVKAQQDLRNKGFNDPKYWATFILLDAL